jgi:hypothetical protein
MPNQIIHEAHKVKYKWTFNQDVETGTFWDGSPYIINKPGLKLIDMEMESEFGVEKPNRIIADLELGWAGKEGFKGEIYINGLVKNPRGMHDYGPDGTPRSKGNAFDSRSFGTSNKGWTPYKTQPVNGKWTKVPLPTNLNSSYKAFDLNKFLDTKQQLENGGIEVQFGDVLVVQWSNFDINCPYKWNISNASGYPYQRIMSRSCSMSYGTLFVLENHPTEVSFRPPVLWPEEDRKNRPLHAVSKLNGKLPGDSELVDNPAPQFKMPTYANDPSFKTFCYGFAFGGGTDYSQAMPLYSASIDGKISAYGAYYQGPLMNRLQTLYSKNVLQSQRFENLKTVIQWGIDAFGSIKTYTSTSSGAGQKPCTARPWSIISGYFLNELAMRMPETTMISDTARSNGLLSDRGAGVESEDGEESESQSNEKMIMIYGDPHTSLTAKKRWHALQTALEALCYFKVVDQVGNDLDYRTLGKTHRRIFSAVGANLEETNENTKYGLIHVYRETSTFTGRFAKIQWNTVPADLNKGWAASHDGKSSTFWYSYIKVISGPGAGDTLYRVIKSWGDFRNAKPETSQNISGYGFILDRPWQNGQPDETSKFQMITCIDKNVGEVFYLIGPTRFNGMADANLSPTSPYAGICEVLVVKLYGWMNYIEKKTGVNPDLDKDAVLTHEYIQKILTSSPYEWVSYSTDHHYMGCYPWDTAILNKWYYRPNTAVEIAKTINWSTIPGIKTWCGVDVSTFENKLIGDFNNDGVVDAIDQGMLLAKWGTQDPDYDLDGDGIVDGKDMAIFLSQFGKTKDNP